MNFVLCTCSVYLLDYTSEVEVTSCVDCRIFIGELLVSNQQLPSLHCWCRTSAQAWATASACSSNCLVQSCWGQLQGPLQEATPSKAASLLACSLQCWCWAAA